MTALASHPTKTELSLPNTVGQFDAGDNHGCRAERLQPVHGRASSFDRPMVLLDDVC
jgi:hypothetical protein